MKSKFWYKESSVLWLLLAGYTLIIASYPDTACYNINCLPVRVIILPVCVCVCVCVAMQVRKRSVSSWRR